MKKEAENPVKDYFHIAAFDRTTDDLTDMSGSGKNAWKVTTILNPDTILYLGKVVLYEDDTVEFLGINNTKNMKYVDWAYNRIKNKKKDGVLGIQGDYAIYHEGDSHFWPLIVFRMNDQPNYIISNRVGDKFFAKKQVEGEQELLEGFSEYNKGKEFRNSIIFSRPKYGKTSY